MQFTGCATLEAHLCDDLGVLKQRHVGDQQTGHTLFLTVGCLGIVPQAREVLCERHDALALLLIELDAPGLALLLIALLGSSKRSQCLVPLGFQRIGYETVVGIDTHVTTTGELDLITCPLDLLPSQPVELS
ncbi:hypothetical protein AWB82_04252 [Caballeronia glebae]|uniref:Uncharacterized protein n=1 Tax=Caballeronia glebae TaxID=1777143 RepID=A0A158BKM4_9BURK|nr:hypothetical protein [Caballeronia glebae]SAK70591.1 hypothetical protein AWB82_04252 [Caballeronia glebae]